MGKSPDVEMAILDHDGTVLPPGLEGEVVVRGPMLMPGYLDGPEANQAAFWNGWFRTGDIGRLDADGYRFLVGRRKEIINRGDKKIVPLEVDIALSMHPAVAELAAFAIAHRTLGEDVAAAAVLHAAAQASELELRRFASERLSPYKVPLRIVFVPRIPRTTLGKPKRSVLAEQCRDLALQPLCRYMSLEATRRRPTDIEIKLLDIWRNVLRLDQI